MPWDQEDERRGGLEGRESSLLRGAPSPLSRPVRPHGCVGLFPQGIGLSASALGSTLPARWAGLLRRNEQSQRVW